MYSDKAIGVEGVDRFQRKPFADRISNLIKNRKEHDSLVVGIYGKWGEGKTSVLDLIKSGLKDDKIQIIDFNPWMFNSEEQLILTFFKSLKEALEELDSSSKEKFGDFLQKYS